MNEKLKVFLWRLLKQPQIDIAYLLSKEDRLVQKARILTSEQTIDLIVKEHLSVSRFGDGELQMISHYLAGGSADEFKVDTFQDYIPILAKSLLDVFSSDNDKVLVCVPYALVDSRVYYGYDSLFYRREWLARKTLFMNHLKRSTIGDTNFTRFYLHRQDIKDYPRYIESMKRIWDKREVVLVEGQFSRLGVGNDLFDNASSIERVICPAKNAFSIYEELLSYLETLPKDKLFLLALGHTATVLASDLAKNGFQAIDLGHVDIEYEWYRMGAKEKVAVNNKYVNEVASGRISSAERNEKYAEQVIYSIGC